MLPEEWCDDLVRRRKAKIPDEVCFQTKPQLAAGVCEQVSGWEIPTAPVLADCAYGDDTRFRSKLHEQELEYVLAVSAKVSVYGPETTFAVPAPSGTAGRPRSVARPDRKPESVRALAEPAASESLEDAAVPDNTGGRGRAPAASRSSAPSRLTRSATTICRPVGNG